MQVQRIRDEADVRAVEARGLGALLAGATPYELLVRGARLWPASCAIRYVPSGGPDLSERVISYNELLGEVTRAANLFRRLGADKSNSVAIFMPHVPQAQVALWAAEIASRAAPINPMLRPDYVRALLAAARVKVAVVLGANDEADTWERLVGVLRKAGVAVILDADADRPSVGSDGRFDELSAAEESERFTFSDVLDPDDIAAFFPTGGTTGTPKLTLHTHRNEAFVAAGAALMYDLAPGEVLLNGFPLFHVAGAFVYGLSSLLAGVELLIPGRLGMRNRKFVSSIWEQVERYRINVIGGVPTVISALNNIPVGQANISCFRVMLTGGSPLPPELADTFEQLTGKPVRNILGMTECSGVVTIEPFHGPRVSGSTGLRLPFTEVNAFRHSGGVIDLGAPCAAGETGIIALRGLHVSPGYQDPTLNPGTFEREGWLVSGDLGHVDDLGRVHISGRAKDVIIRGSHNIDPATIEDALLEHPAVAVAAAVGQVDAYAGELPVAFVSLKPGTSADPEDIRSFIEPLMPEPAAHPKTIWILSELPLTPVGKIYKPALKALAARHVIEDRIRSFGIGADDFSVAVVDGATSATATIAVRTDVDRINAVLVGLPIKCEVRSSSEGGEAHQDVTP